MDRSPQSLYAPRPSRSNWGRVIYNVLQDAAKPLTSEELWSLIPAAMHTPHSKSKFATALTNMSYKGYLETEKIPGSRSNKYKVATLRHYRVARRKVSEQAKKYNAKKRAKVRAKMKPASSLRTDNPNANGAATNTLMANIDLRLKVVDDAIKRNLDRREKLLEMRKLSADL